jgi:hypothetical protein
MPTHRSLVQAAPLEAALRDKDLGRARKAWKALKKAPECPADAAHVALDWADPYGYDGKFLEDAMAEGDLDMVAFYWNDMLNTQERRDYNDLPGGTVLTHKRKLGWATTNGKRQCVDKAGFERIALPGREPVGPAVHPKRTADQALAHLATLAATDAPKRITASGEEDISVAMGVALRGNVVDALREAHGKGECTDAVLVESTKLLDAMLRLHDAAVRFRNAQDRLGARLRVQGLAFLIGLRNYDERYHALETAHEGEIGGFPFDHRYTYEGAAAEGAAQCEMYAALPRRLAAALRALPVPPLGFWAVASRFEDLRSGVGDPITAFRDDRGYLRPDNELTLAYKPFLREGEAIDLTGADKLFVPLRVKPRVSPLGALGWRILKAKTITLPKVALWWQEATVKALCAPGGRGRAADLAAFSAEFV